jgi:hypothetical protein
VVVGTRGDCLMRLRVHPGAIAAPSAIVTSKIHGSNRLLPLVNWRVLPSFSAIRRAATVNGQRHIEGPVWSKF